MTLTVIFDVLSDKTGQKNEFQFFRFRQTNYETAQCNQVITLSLGFTRMLNHADHEARRHFEALTVRICS